MKRSFFAILLIAIISIFSFVSCEEPETVVPPKEYSTPTIKGRVSIPSGKNVKAEDIFVKVIDEDGKTVTIQKANADATFVVEGLSLSSKYSILFTSVEPEFGNRSLTRGTDSNGVGGWLNDIVPALKEGKDVGSVKMKPLGTIKGKALIDGKSEHYDITVYIPGTSYIAMTDDYGNYNIYNVPEGTYKLRYTLNDHLPVMIEDVNLVCPENEENPELKVKDVLMKSSLGEVRGYAFFEGESNHTGISIKLESEDKTQTKQTTTSADGSYTINGVIPGSYRIIASFADYTPMSSSYFLVEAASDVLVSERLTLMENAGTIKGNVSLSDKDSDFSGILITFSNGITSFTTSTDASGAFSKTLKPGAYSVTASYPGYTSQSSSIIVAEASTVSMDFGALPRSSGAVTGHVLLSGSTDYSGVVITLSNSALLSSPKTSVSAADGSFRIEDISKAGTYLLSFSKDGFVSDNTHSVDVSLGSVSDVGNIVLKTLKSTVTGKVELEGTTIFDNVTILLRNENDSYTSTTNQKGEYLVSGVMPGTYDVYASRDGYVSSTLNGIVVEPAGEKTLDTMTLSVAVKSITGKVALEESTDHAGVLVTATSLSDSTKVYSAITNSEGRFTLAGLVPGEYLVVLSCSNYNTMTLPTINVTGSTVHAIADQTLTIAKGTVSGLARLEGYTDHSGIKVTLLGTKYSAVTAEDGSYSMEVPSRNYPGGLRFEHDDYETVSHASTVTVLTSSTYAIPDKELKAINVPLVSGKVTVNGVTSGRYDGITVTIVGHPEFTVVTGNDGTWRFEHVPVGTHTFEFTRENARKVTKIVAVEPSPEVKVEILELIPDSVTFTGNVTLASVSDYSGVTVRITTPDSVELRTVTNAAGAFYISNIVASRSHTIYFEKEGWDTVSFDIPADTYEPLSVISFTDTHPVTLVDTTAPVLTGMAATIGRSTAEGREIGIYIYGSDSGSGIKYIQGNTEDNFTSIDEEAFYNPFILTVPDEVGAKTIYVRVKDAAGNVSNTVSANVVITNDKTSLSGPLTGDKLHLTKVNSPYLMTGNVLVPEGKTLIIDPGVEIQINGDYYIQVEGQVSAVGTESERIRIYGIDGGTNNWDGIKFLKTESSMLSFVDIIGLKNGITGYCDINHALITANGWAIGKSTSYSDGYILIGNVEDSVINGSVSVKNKDILRCEIAGSTVYLYQTKMVADNTISGYVTIESSNIDGNVFSGTSLTTSYSLLYNNKVSSTNVTSSSDFQRYVTYNGSKMSIYSAVLSEVEFTNCTFSKFGATVNNSNFINSGAITITTDRKSQLSFDATGNYWGDLNTVELRANGHDSDLSFIHDYMNDFNLTKVDVSGWKESAISGIGYLGDDGRSDGPAEYAIGDRGPAGGWVFYDKGFYSDGWRYLEAAPSDIGRYVFGYYRPDGANNKQVMTSTTIGAGRGNTERLVDYMDIDGKAYSSSSGSNTAEYAARKCLDYEYGGYDDWFLPSMDELCEMYKALKCEGGENHGSYCPDKTHVATSTAETRATFAHSYYWSSSEYNSLSAWEQNFGNGSQYYNGRYLNYYVRAVRAF